MMHELEGSPHGFILFKDDDGVLLISGETKTGV
jgi:hypothetical protein